MGRTLHGKRRLVIPFLAGYSPSSGGGGGGVELRVNGSTGSDSNTYAQVAAGTHKWATIGRALWGQTARPSGAQFASPPTELTDEAVKAGETIIVEGTGGPYIHAAMGDRFNAIYQPIATGTLGNPVTIKAEGTVDLRQNAVTGTGSTGTVDTYTENYPDGPTIQDTSQSWTTNQWQGHVVKITGGTGVGQVGWVDSNTSDTLTLSRNADETIGMSQGYSSDGTNSVVALDGTSTYEFYVCGPVIGSGDTIARDYVVWTGDTASDKWRVNGNYYYVHMDTALAILNNCSNVTIENYECHEHAYCVYNDNNSAIRIDNADSCTMRNNWLRADGANGHNNAMILGYSMSNCLIEHNDMAHGFHGVFVKGEYVNGDNEGNIIRYNKIYDITQGIEIYDSDGATTNYCHSNLIYDFRLGIAGGARGIILDGNFASPSNWEIWNNTVYGAHYCWYSYLSMTGVTAVVAKNSILVPTAGWFSVGFDSVNPSGSGLSMDYNAAWKSGGGNVYTSSAGNFSTAATWNASSGYEANGFNADPVFTNAAADDYTLNSGSSPYIGVGDALSAIHGAVTSPDLGCYWNNSTMGVDLAA